MMNNIFLKNSTTVTVKYDNYEWRETDSGELFLVPSADSDFVIFDPLEDVERLVLDTAAASCLVPPYSSLSSLHMATR